MSNGRPEITAAISAPFVICACDWTTYEKFMIAPYKTSVTIKPYTESAVFVLPKSPFLKSIPDRKPMMPNANICHGVHGPCPKNMLEQSAVTAPTKNPASAPSESPEIITIAATGLNCIVM